MIHFTKIAYRRWTTEEEQLLKQMFIEGRQEHTPHKELWKTIAKALKRRPSEVQRKMTRMYYKDDDLHALKQKNWTRNKILEELQQLYLENKPIHKTALPAQLCFTILKACSPTKRHWFDSIDHAIAEAILLVGHPRQDDGTLDTTHSFKDIDEALNYVRKQHKLRHSWTLEEIKDILTALHNADYPITLPFLTHHYNLYKNVIGINRKLESFKDVIKKFIEDGSIKSYPDLVCTIAPEYIAYYNEDKTRQKLSTEEIRVKKILDRFKIPYAIPRFGRHKISTTFENYPHFIPDFIIFDTTGAPCAVVEVFGSIGDRVNAGVDEIYNNKTKAKQDFWKSREGIDFIEIHNNSGRCDLGDRELFQALAKYISPSSTPLQDLEAVITSDAAKIATLIKTSGIAIYYNPMQKNYRLHTAGQDLRLDSLFEIPKLTSRNPTLKKILETIHFYTDKNKQEPKPGEHMSASGIGSYTPPAKDPFYDHNRGLTVKE